MSEKNVRTKKVLFLTAEEEQQLAKKWQDLKDVKARDRLIMSYRPFALRQAEIAARAGRGSIEDLSQEATLGLLEAAERFDYKRNVRFATFARFFVQQRLNRYHFDMSGPTRVGTTQSDKRALYRFSKLRAQYEAKYKRELDDVGRAWIARQAGTSLAVLRDVEAHLRNEHVSLDASAFADSNSTIKDTLPDETQGDDAALRRLIDDEQTELLEYAMTQLSERERVVIERRFGIGSRRGAAPEKQATIAATFGVTRERVRQIEMRAIATLAKILQSPPSRAERAAAVAASRRGSTTRTQDVERAKTKTKRVVNARKQAKRTYQTQQQLKLIDWCPASGWVYACSVSREDTVA